MKNSSLDSVCLLGWIFASFAIAASILAFFGWSPGRVSAEAPYADRLLNHLAIVGLAIAVASFACAYSRRSRLLPGVIANTSVLFVVTLFFLLSR
jgi:hypothetical protein